MSDSEVDDLLGDLPYYFSKLTFEAKSVGKKLNDDVKSVSKELNDDAKYG